MDISEYHPDLGGEWIEFQVTDYEGVENPVRWRKNSIFLMATPGPHYDVFEKYLSDGWWLSFNQLNREIGLKLAADLKKFPEASKLCLWIESNLKDKSYLNVLGV